MDEELRAMRAEIASLREEIAEVRAAIARIPPPGYGVTSQGCFYQLPFYPGSTAQYSAQLALAQRPAAPQQG
jgi:hypothetical protein